MSRLELYYNQNFLDRVFPFSIIFNKELEIIAAGRSIKKIIPDIINQPLRNIFTVLRPASAGYDFNAFEEYSTQIFILKSITGLKFRGEMYLIDETAMAFWGSPWLTDADDLQANNLAINDYALHDSVTDLLQVLKLKDSANKDALLLNEALEESENRYKELVERGSDLIYKINENGILTYVNEVTTRVLGYKKSEMLGSSIGKFLVKKERAIVLDGFFDHLTGEVQERNDEFALIKADKSIIYINQIAKVFPTKNGENEIRCFAKDITEKKQALLELNTTELRFRNLIKNLQSGVMLESEDRKIVLINEFFLEIFGLDMDPDMMIGYDCENAIEEYKPYFKDGEKFASRITELLEKRELATNDELELVNGKICERDYIPVYNKDKYLGHLWQYRDITERKKSSEQLEKAKKEAVAAKEAEKQFIANMSHEIRTPLNAIIGMLHLLKDTQLTETQREYVEIQQSSTEILYGLINDILDISKIESGSIDIVEEQINLREILEQQHKTFYHQLKEKPIEILLDIDNNINEYLLGDKVVINQILYNLIGNAIKFTLEGQIAINAKLGNSSNDFHEIIISVKDTGIGIKKSRLNEVFKKFKQADKSISVRFSGTGLGLAITKQLVELMNGTIEVDSIEGVGSNFSVKLKLKRTKVRIESDSFTTTNTDHKKSLKGFKILVAEDNAMNTFYTKKILNKLEIDADFVVNGEDAHKMADANDYDLILMDIRMPILDGLEATKIIRMEGKRNQKTPILALTASVFKTEVKKAMDAGTDDFLSKPFTPDQLIDKIEHILMNCEAKSSSPSANQPPVQFNKNSLFELYGDDNNLAKEMYNLFTKINLPIFNGIRQTLTKENFDQAREDVHKVKPSFSMIGLNELQDKMQMLEEFCESKDNRSLCLYKTIKEDLDRILPEVEAQIKGK